MERLDTAASVDFHAPELQHLRSRPSACGCKQGGCCLTSSTSPDVWTLGATGRGCMYREEWTVVASVPGEEPPLSSSLSFTRDSLSVVARESISRASGGGGCSCDCHVHRATFDGCTGCGPGESGTGCGRQPRARRNGVLSIRSRRNGVLNLRRRRNGVLEADIDQDGLTPRMPSMVSPRVSSMSHCSIDGGCDCCCRIPAAHVHDSCCDRRMLSDCGGEASAIARAAVIAAAAVAEEEAGSHGDGGTRLGSAPACRPCDSGEHQQRQLRGAAPQRWQRECEGSGHGTSRPQRPFVLMHEPCRCSSSRRAGEGHLRQRSGEQPPASSQPPPLQLEGAEADDTLSAQRAATAAAAALLVQRLEGFSESAASRRPSGHARSPYGGPDAHVPCGGSGTALDPEASCAPDGASALPTDALRAPLGASSRQLAQGEATVRGDMAAAKDATGAGSCSGPCAFGSAEAANTAAAARCGDAMSATEGPALPAVLRPVPQVLPAVKAPVRRARSLAAIIMPRSLQQGHLLPALAPQLPRLQPRPPLGSQRERLQPLQQPGIASTATANGPQLGSPPGGLSPGDYRRSASSLPAVGGAPPGSAQEHWPQQPASLPGGEEGHEPSLPLAVAGAATAGAPRGPARAWPGSGSLSTRRASWWSTATSLLSSIEGVPEEGEEQEEEDAGASPAGDMSEGRRATPRRLGRVAAADVAVSRCDGLEMGASPRAAVGDGSGSGYVDAALPCGTRYHSFTAGSSAAFPGPPTAGTLAACTSRVHGSLANAAGAAPQRRSLLAPLSYDSAAQPPASSPRAPSHRSSGPLLEGRPSADPIHSSWPALSSESAGLIGLGDGMLSAAVDVLAKGPALGRAPLPLEGSARPQPPSVPAPLADASAARHGKWLQPARLSDEAQTGGLFPKPAFAALPSLAACPSVRALSEGSSPVVPPTAPPMDTSYLQSVPPVTLPRIPGG